MKFRKKPVVIEAWQLTREMIEANLFRDEPLPIPAPLKRARSTCNPVQGTIDRADYAIETLEGTMYAVEDDWIIKGVKGEFYPCKPDIFAATYEPVEAVP